MEKYLEEEQRGFRKGRSSTDAIFSLHQILEKRKEFNLPTYILFLDYEKAHDKINRKLLWTILREASIPMNSIKAIKNLYSNTHINSRIRTTKIRKYQN
jgi:sorting nexin-29